MSACVLASHVVNNLQYSYGPSGRRAIKSSRNYTVDGSEILFPTTVLDGFLKPVVIYCDKLPTSSTGCLAGFLPSDVRIRPSAGRRSPS